VTGKLKDLAITLVKKADGNIARAQFPFIAALLKDRSLLGQLTMEYLAALPDAQPQQKIEPWSQPDETSQSNPPVIAAPNVAPNAPRSEDPVNATRLGMSHQRIKNHRHPASRLRRSPVMRRKPVREGH
jgi:hypothetical protein